MKSLDNLPERQNGKTVVVSKKLRYSFDDIKRALHIPDGARVSFAGNEWEQDLDKCSAIIVRIGESK